MPISPDTCTKSRRSSRPPNQSSARPARFASFPTSRGRSVTPVRARSSVWSGTSRQPRLGALRSRPVEDSTRPGTATPTPPTDTPSRAASAWASPTRSATWERPSSTVRPRGSTSRVQLTRTRPVRSTSAQERVSTPISTPSPCGPVGDSDSAVPRRPRPTRCSGPPSTTRPAVIIRSTRLETVALVRPVRAATDALDSPSAVAMVLSTNAELCLRTVCCPAGPDWFTRPP